MGQYKDQLIDEAVEPDDYPTEAGYDSRALNEGARYRAQRRDRIRRMVDAIKVAGGCDVCGFDEHPAALEFHHVDPTTKHRDIGRMVSIGAGMAAIEREIDKTVILCANHHAIRTANDRKARA